MEVFGIAVAAVIASAAWLYQRAWERQAQRILRYQEVLDRLPAFTEGNLDIEQRNEMITELRRLWLSAPDDVVRSGEKLLDLIEGRYTDPEQVALGECVLAMRRDATMASALWPRFWGTRLQAKEFRLRFARQAGHQKAD